MIFDSHAHMDVEEFDKDRAEVLEKIHSGKISYVLNPGVDLKTSQGAVRLAEEYPWIFAAVGYYPQECRHMNYDLLEEIEKLAVEHPKVRAIGEIGLDYHWNDTPHDVQQFWFRQQIRLAEKLRLPIIIHDREAHGDVYEILVEEKAFEKTKVLFHCYSGSAEFARQLLAKGCYFSIAGPVTYANNKKAPAVLDVIPLDRMCVETDSPYLTPEPFRGQRNDPSFTEYTVQRIAELKNLTFDEVAEATCQTAKSLFGIE